MADHFDTDRRPVLQVPRSSHWRNLATLGFVAIIAALAMWPAFVNGGPFFMPDTPSYLRASASGFYKFLHVKSDWASEYLRVYEPQTAAPGLRADATASPGIPVTLSGRSIYYGALLFFSDLAGNLLLVAAIQCTLAAAAVILTVNGVIRSLDGTPRHEALLIGVAAVVTTPLAFFACYLMPDIFGGFALLATASLLFLARSLSRVATGTWILLLGYSLVVHTANIPVVLGSTAAAYVYGWARGTALPKLSLIAIGACLIAAIVAQILFGQVVRASTGASPVRPPFFAMRLISDGPGYDYLAHHCGGEHYIYCRTIRTGREPSDTLLWSPNPQVSLFHGLPPDLERQSAREQSRFAAHVLLAEPIGVIDNSAMNALNQLANFRLDGFNYSPAMIERFRDSIPERTMREISTTKAFQQRMPTHLSEAMSALTAVASVLFIIVALGLAEQLRLPKVLRGFLITLLAGVAINAIVCGAISGPKGRYQMRLIWILPLAAAATGAGLARSRRDRVRVATPDGGEPTQIPSS